MTDKARELNGKLVHVTGEMTPDGLQVATLDEVIAVRPPRLPELPKMPQLAQDDVFGTIFFDAAGGITLTADDGTTYRVLVLCGNDDALLKKARRLQTWRFGVQARGVVAGDVLILSGVWPAEPRGPK